MLKPAVAKALNELLAPIHAAYEASKEWQDIALKAYPPPAKKEKKVKDKGSRYPVKKAGDADPAANGSADAKVDKAADGVGKLTVSEPSA